MTPAIPASPREQLLEVIRARRTPDGRLIDAIEAAAVAEERARIDDLLEALDAYMDPENQFTHSRWHVVEAARAALIDPESPHG